MELIVQKSNNKFQRQDQDKHKLSNLQDGWYVVQIHDSNYRSNAQNRRYWLILTILAQETWHTKEELHEVFKLMFLESDTTRTVVWIHADYTNRLENRVKQQGYIIPD